MERECMEFDVVIVGAGPAGLACAIHLKQLASQNDAELSVCIIEKGAEVGAHILSGAVFETRALDELIPDWQSLNAPVNNPVQQDDFIYLTTQYNHLNIPPFLTPATLHNNEENHIISLGLLCQWLAEQAERLGVEIFPGFAAQNVLYSDTGAVVGVCTSDMGLDKQGKQKSTFEAGIELKGKYTIFAEGARGHLGKELIHRFKLDQGKQPQHYALGFKEVWQLPDEQPHYAKGKVIHGVGWPLHDSKTTGGTFVYHLDNHQIAVGLIVDLNYTNPHLSPFDEFQRFKHHPAIAKYLHDGERISFGARAIAKGGLRSLPKQQFPGGLLIGCDAGTLNMGKIKGTHTAMKSGMLSAEAVYQQLAKGCAHNEADYQTLFEASWLHQELSDTQNFGANLHRFGEPLGGMLNVLEQNVWTRLFKRPIPWTVTDTNDDHSQLAHKANVPNISYPKPDGVLSFDKPSSVYLSGTQHEENQPCHLQLLDVNVVTDSHIPQFDEPSQRYCPAGVYEIIEVGGRKQLQINASNCLHCKTCDIKDPSANIKWTPPEGGGGPNYQAM